MISMLQIQVLSKDDQFGSGRCCTLQQNELRLLPIAVTPARARQSTSKYLGSPDEKSNYPPSSIIDVGGNDQGGFHAS
jgi:hypothetical protein